MAVCGPHSTYLISRRDHAGFHRNMRAMCLLRTLFGNNLIKTRERRLMIKNYNFTERQGLFHVWVSLSAKILGIAFIFCIRYRSDKASFIRNWII